jgi:outer membrane protein OmpA-like peptidoglycan-associated protein
MKKHKKVAKKELKKIKGGKEIKVRTIRLEGHRDEKKAGGYNSGLSQRRASDEGK